MAVTYKQVGEGCEYTIEPMYSGAGEVLTIAGSKRREPSRSGLMLEWEVPYPIGTLVQMDIKFPGQEYTYRAKGIVSLVADAPESGAIPLGITITGMDKLDKYGISVSISEERPAPPTPQPAPPPRSEPQKLPLATMSPPDEFTDDDDGDLEFDDTALNPIIGAGESAAENWRDDSAENESVALGDAADTPELFAPVPVTPQQKTRIQDFLTPDDFSADTVRPGVMRAGDVAEAVKQSKRSQFKIEEIRIIFQTLSLMMPQDGFGEKTYFEDVFLPPTDSVPPSVDEALMHPGKRADFFVRIDTMDAGRLCAVVPTGSSDSPPSAYVMEQLFLMYTGMPVQIIRDKELPLGLSEMACISRLASGTSSMRGVMAFDKELVEQLVAFKSGPSLPPDDERLSYEEVAYNDRTSRVSLVVAGNNDRHRVTVPLDARISQVPAKVAGPMSAQINSVVVEAFESMETLYNAENHDEAANFALSLARRLIKCEAAICALLAPEQDELYIAAIDGAIPETRLGGRLSISDGLIGFCLRTGNVARSDQPKEIKASLLRETGLAVDNIMCAPITSGNRAIGAIELMNSLGDTGFSRDTADLLAYIANSLGEFIEGAETL